MNTIINYITFLYNKDQLIFLTLIILIIYTIYTYKLWRESTNQTGLNLMPIPAFYFRTRDDKELIRIRNLGNKPMFNTKIEPWNLIIFLKKGEENWRLEFQIPFPNIIKEDEERDLTLKTLKNGSETDFMLWPHLHPKYAKFYIPLKVTFQDLRGIKYQAKYSMGTGGLNLIKAPKRWKYYFPIINYFHNLIIEKIKKEYYRIKIQKSLKINNKKY